MVATCHGIEGANRDAEVVAYDGGYETTGGVEFHDLADLHRSVVCSVIGTSRYGHSSTC